MVVGGWKSFVYARKHQSQLDRTSVKNPREVLLELVFTLRQLHHRDEFCKVPVQVRDSNFLGKQLVMLSTPLAVVLGWIFASQFRQNTGRHQLINKLVREVP